MKPSHLALLALMALPATQAMAQVAREPSTTADGLGLALSTDIPHRYVSPRGVGFSPENVPSSALSPIPPNVEQVKHAYALGEASIPDAVRVVRRRVAHVRIHCPCTRVAMVRVRVPCGRHGTAWVATRGC